ncbi:MAG: CPBP family intramembrane metalloprotease [Bryobacteraceae bacterium]|nr:CPBP family intramembrane metalloprotease [Bryobacteraceae bacterium]
MLAAEMAALFVAIPLLFYFRVIPRQFNPLLLLYVTVVALWLILRRDPTFDRHMLWNMGAVRAEWKFVLARASVFCALIGLGVWLFLPDHLFILVRRTPAVWLILMVLYPFFSVYPQEVFFRAFFFHRYQSLLGRGVGAIMSGAALFGFVHIVFGNWISVLLSGAGGLLFARTYLTSGSLALASIEHALYGNFIFTIGLGEFFFHATRQ